MTLQHLHVLGETIRKPKVISVEKRHVLAARELQARIARGTHPSVLVFGVFHVGYPVGVRGRVAPGDPRGAVGGAVVDEDQLPLVIRLREHALDGLTDMRLTVEEDDDAGDEGTFRREPLIVSRVIHRCPPLHHIPQHRHSFPAEASQAAPAWPAPARGASLANPRSRRIVSLRLPALTDVHRSGMVVGSAVRHEVVNDAQPSIRRRGPEQGRQAPEEEQR